jgi:hypothetical protein
MTTNGQEPEADHYTIADPALILGDWVARVTKRDGMAVLETHRGAAFRIDRRAVELAAMALGIELARPALPALDMEPVKFQTRCGWCKALMNQGPLDANGHDSTGICATCTPLLCAPSEIGR